MGIDWDAEVLAPVMAVFGEGDLADQSTWPIYMPQDRPGFPLPHAVFDRAYRQIVELSDGAQGTSENPVLGVRASLFATPPAQGDIVYIRAANPNEERLPGQEAEASRDGRETYIVADVRPDGHGHVLLVLMVAR